MNSADQPKAIPLWPDGAPGSEDWTQQEQESVLPPPDSFKVVHNVTEPTLTAFLPNPSVARLPGLFGNQHLQESALESKISHEGMTSLP